MKSELEEDEHSYKLLLPRRKYDSSMVHDVVNLALLASGKWIAILWDGHEEYTEFDASSSSSWISS